MKKLVIFLIYIQINFMLFSAGSNNFELSLKNDVILGGISVVTFTTGQLIRETPKNLTEPYNWIDSDFTFEFNTKLDQISDFTALAPTLALPLLLDSWDLENISTLGPMYAESFLFAYGVKDILKSIIHRPRPYNFYESTPSEMLEENDRFLGFPSGHSTVSFMTASFITYIYGTGDNPTLNKYLVGAGTFGLALTTAYLRVRSGNHYLLDVIAGGANGAFWGFFIPYLHTKDSSKTSGITPTISSKTIGISWKMSL